MKSTANNYKVCATLLRKQIGALAPKTKPIKRNKPILASLWRDLAYAFYS